MPNAKAAQGTVIKRNGVVIGEIKSVGGLDISVDTIDVTTLTSTNGFREFIPGLRDAGEISISGNFDASDLEGQIQMLTDLKAGTVSSYSIEFPEIVGAVWAFQAFPTAFSTGAESEGEITFEGSFKVTGEPSLDISNSAGLTAPFLVFSSGNLVPVASGSTYIYVHSVATGTSNLTITPTATAGVITIIANGASQVVTSGQASTAIALGAAGSVTLVTIAVKEVGKITKTYNINVARAAA